MTLGLRNRKIQNPKSKGLDFGFLNFSIYNLRIKKSKGRKIQGSKNSPNQGYQDSRTKKSKIQNPRVQILYFWDFGFLDFWMHKSKNLESWVQGSKGLDFGFLDFCILKSKGPKTKGSRNPLIQGSQDPRNKKSKIQKPSIWIQNFWILGFGIQNPRIQKPQGLKIHQSKDPRTRGSKNPKSKTEFWIFGFQD